MIVLIEKNQEALERLCKQYGVRRLELFGSALTDDRFDAAASAGVAEVLSEFTVPGGHPVAHSRPTSCRPPRPVSLRRNPAASGHWKPLPGRPPGPFGKPGSYFRHTCTRMQYVPMRIAVGCVITNDCHPFPFDQGFVLHDDVFDLAVFRTQSHPKAINPQITEQFDEFFFRHVTSTLDNPQFILKIVSSVWKSIIWHPDNWPSQGDAFRALTVNAWNCLLLSIVGCHSYRSASIGLASAARMAWLLTVRRATASPKPPPRAKRVQPSSIR